MEKGKTAGSSGGFTIIEVMIFLVVTGILMISGLRLLSGQLTRTAFRQTVRENDAQLKTVLNEVASGFYPNKGDFTCTIVGGSPSFSTIGPGNSQGQNEDCIFLGKVIRVGSGGTSYSIYTIVGRRLASGVEVTKLEDARPVALAKFTGDPVGTADATDTINLTNDIQITKVASVDTSGGLSSIGAFGFLMSVGKSAAGDLVSGAEGVSLIPLPGTSIGGSDAEFETAVTSMQQAHLGAAKDIALCIRQGGPGGQQAAIVFGSEGRQLTTEVIMGAPPSLYNCPA